MMPGPEMEKQGPSWEPRKREEQQRGALVEIKTLWDA